MEEVRSFRLPANLQDERWGLPAAFTGGNPAAAPGVYIAQQHGSDVMRDTAGHEVETAVEARAGFLDRPVLVVLCVSTVLAALAMGAIWLGFVKL
jgi:hypothetical protein